MWAPAMGTRAIVHIDNAEAVRPADVENEHLVHLLHFKNLETIGRTYLPRTWRRLAAGVRCIPLEAGLAIFVERSGPGLEWDVRQFEICRESSWPCRDDTFGIARQLCPALPDPVSFLPRGRSEIDASIGQTRCGTRHRRLLTILGH